jgi:type IV pilus assembly protein PilM
MFKGQDSILALDFGTAVIKLLELSVERGKIRVRHADSAEIPNPIDGDRGESRSESLPRIVTAIADLFASCGIKPGKIKRMVTSLPGSQVSIKQIKSLALPEEEMRSALVFEARKHMPVEGDILMDYQVLGQHADGNDVLLAVTTKQAVINHHSMLEACGLSHSRHGLLEAPTLALWNVFLAARQNELPKLPHAILNLGAQSTHLSFYYENGLFLSRDIPIAGDKFTEDIRQSQGGDFAAAEKAKREGYMFQGASHSNANAGTILELENEGSQGYPSLQSLVRELQRSIRFYLKESGQTRLETMTLVGGGAADKGLKDHLTRELALRIEVLNPFDGLDLGAGRKIRTPECFAQVMGMGLRGLHEFFPHQLK